MPFRLIPDFDADSRKPKCSTCGNIKQEDDRGVFRGAEIEFEGYYDVCEACIREASSALGIMHEAVEVISDTTNELADAQAALADRDELIRRQAEYIAVLAGEGDEE